jgi:hypothetical protein
MLRKYVCVLQTFLAAIATYLEMSDGQLSPQEGIVYFRKLFLYKLSS